MIEKLPEGVPINMTTHSDIMVYVHQVACKLNEIIDVVNATPRQEYGISPQHSRIGPIWPAPTPSLGDPEE